MEGRLRHIYHVFKHRPTAVPLEDELTLPTRGARFTFFFVAVYGIDWRFEPARLREAVTPDWPARGGALGAPMGILSFSAVSCPVAGCTPGTTRRLREARTICPQPSALPKASA